MTAEPLMARDSDASPGPELSWSGLSLKIGDKTILNNVTGRARPGKLLAIMGPSGAGKSTLLNFLAGRLGGKVQTDGSIALEGENFNPGSSSSKAKIAYVMQEDRLCATESPREALRFVAAMRMGKLKKSKRQAMVEDIIRLLGLQKCADTLTGSARQPGLSGGEKKRLSIAIELISKPKILFLDEPTSGLDSYAAVQLINLLKELSNSGCTVITTIHQPSSEIFDLMDDVHFLCNGQVVYASETGNEMESFFSQFGPEIEIPEKYNPADHVIYLLQTLLPGKIDEICYSWQAQTVQGLDLYGAEKKGNKSYTVSRVKKSHVKNEKAGFFTQCFYLGRRELMTTVRDKASFGSRFGGTIFINLIVALIFKGCASWTTSPESIPGSEVIAHVQDEFGAIVQVAIGAMFGVSQPLLLAFPLERPVFLRESNAGIYSNIAYFLSKLLVEIPLAIVQCAVIYAITYWLIGFQANFLYLTLVTALLGVVSASTALFLGALASNPEAAIQLGPLVFVPQLLFAGFFIKITKIPIYMRWIQYLCALKYAINILLVLEFGDTPKLFPSETDESLYNDAVYGCANVTDHACVSQVDNSYALFPSSTVEPDKMYIYFVVLFAIFAVFRFLSCITLVMKARSF